MSTPILATKLYIPPPRPKIVLRPRLIERLNEGLRHNHGFSRKLTLISAPAGFGKTTLVSEWVNQKGEDLHPFKVAWMSLDEGDNDPTRFLVYLVAALQTIVANIGAGAWTALQSPQPPPIEVILTALLNEISSVSDNFILVLDDYHVIDAQPVDATTAVDASTAVDDALTFLLQHLPPQMHLVIVTREDPQLPLARLRARGQLSELRATELRFTPTEATAFLNQAMGLNLSAKEIAALETRTEGWIAGLQLAALALQGSLSLQETGSTQRHQDTASFIKSFTGSHHFVMDYLVEEVLHQQSESVQTFLLYTSILDRLCAPLCEAVLRTPSGFGQETLEYLERANLFIIPLDNKRCWYRYHHLFADLLRQRLQQRAHEGIHKLHLRASAWYEENDLEIEAFHHATAAHDVDRATRLVEGGGMPLLFRGAAGPVLNWLESLPPSVLDANPSLWVMYASALLFASRVHGVEEKLQAAEAALNGREMDDKSRDLVGHIAAIRATLAVGQHQVETIITQSRRALEYLHPNNLPVRTATIWTLGTAYHFQGERAAASRAYSEAIATSQAIGHYIITIMASLGLGNMQEMENQLYLAAETYQRVLQLTGDPPLPIACEAYLGLARLGYEWNELDTAQQHGQMSVQLAQQLRGTDRLIASELFLARLKVTQGDISGAAALLAQASQAAHQHNFVHQLAEVAAAEVLLLLHQGDVAAAAHLAQTHELPVSQARVHLAQEEPSAALAVLEQVRQQVEAKGWADERLKVMVLQAVAYQARGEGETAVQFLREALAVAEPGGFIRLFVDGGLPMAEMLTRIKEEKGTLTLREGEGMQAYIHKLLAACETEKGRHPAFLNPQPLLEPLSQRELEVLQLIAQGLSNREIGQRLFLALDTVKGHNRRIYDKLQVQRRTEAVARGRELGLL